LSLYYVQKLMYELNRDSRMRKRIDDDLDEVLAQFRLTEEEKSALREPDIGKLYVMGVNGQILMHFAALHGFSWDEYIAAMREGVSRYGPVKSGFYATVDDGEGGAV